MQTNDITFAGYAGADAEERQAGNSRVVNFRLCHTDKGQGNREDVTTWVTAVVFGLWCDLASKIKKGDNVVVTGKLQVRDWSPGVGQTRQSVEILVRSMGVVRKEERRNDTQQSGTSSKQPPVGSTERW